MSHSNDQTAETRRTPENRLAWITGGSSGLGLAIAKAFLDDGQDVLIVGRSGEKLDAAHEKLGQEYSSSRIQTLRVDVSNLEEVEKCFFRQYQKDARLDVLVNCVGQSCRGSVENSDPQLYREMMEQNFFTTVNCTTTCIPWLKKSQGTIVNIASLAAKTSWPLVSPYSAAKAALANYSGSLRIELKGTVHVLLVCPGPIFSENQKNRYQSQTKGLEQSANKPGAGAPVKLLDPAQLASQIVKAASKKRNELIVPSKSRILFVASAISSRLGDWVMKVAGKK